MCLRRLNIYVQEKELYMKKVPLPSSDINTNIYCCTATVLECPLWNLLEREGERERGIQFFCYHNFPPYVVGSCECSMACLEMYNQNPEHKGVGAGAPPMSPRISFSNDFVESSRSHSHQQIRAAYRDAPVSSDFEFSVSNYSMMSADELFFKGRLLPLKESCSSSSNFQKTTTLRDELQNEEEDESENISLRPPKNPTRWRGFLGLRKSHIGSKKSEKAERSVEKRTGSYHHDDVQCSKNSQVLFFGKYIPLSFFFCSPLNF